MTRLEQLRKMIDWDVMVLCVSRETGFRTFIVGTLRENNGVFELWQSGSEPVYRFVPEAINSIDMSPGYRPALFTSVCEEGLNSSYH